jgi:carboxylate-amine ligase
MIDIERSVEYPSAAIAERLAAWTEPLRSELSIEPVFPERNGAQRQRRMIDAGASPEEVFAACVHETRETYAQEVTV